jgi:hypothetical protein
MKVSFSPSSLSTFVIGSVVRWNLTVGFFVAVFWFYFFKLSILLFIYLFIYSFFHCCGGWKYIVAFTKVLTMYQIFHT